MSNATDTMESYITTNLNRAIELALQPTNEHDAEGFVYAALNHDPAIPELIDAAMQGCFNLHEKAGRWIHGSWVHSMSHFMPKLWDRRLTEWIKKFHETSFKGANEWNETSCSDRLVGYFAEQAKFDDDPTDYFLTEENLSWMNWGRDSYAKARMEHGVFANENELTICQLTDRLRTASPQWDNDHQCDMIDVARINGQLEELRQAGGDVSEFDGLTRNLLEENLIDLHQRIGEIANKDWPTESKGRVIDNCRRAIAKLQAELDSLPTA